MILTISTTSKNANDFSYLLHKHPDKLQSVDLAIGKVYIFYPEYSTNKTTVALLLDIDTIDMVRGIRNLSGKGFSLGQYVNDRAYVASSFMSVALSKAFSSAMNGRCKERPELVDRVMPFEVNISVLPAPNGGEILIKNLFEPLGYTVEVIKHPLDEEFPQWGDSKYYTVSLFNHIKLKDLLSHLYVLMPALDNEKHYYVNHKEIDKLLKKGMGWLENHPAKEEITKRYLINLNSLSQQALERLNEGIDQSKSEIEPSKEVKIKKENLHQQRLKLVLKKLIESGAKKVIDLGCGQGKLIQMLLKEKQFQKITGMDISYTELTQCKALLHWENMAPKQKERISLFQGSLTYKDKRIEGYDAAAIVEVIEHLDENKLKSFERVVFEFAKPKNVILTTPNKEYNILYENLKAGTMRHTDHRFEWTRHEFENWAQNVAKNNQYTVQFVPIGEIEETVGPPSQMAIFKNEH